MRVAGIFCLLLVNFAYAQTSDKSEKDTYRKIKKPYSLHKGYRGILQGGYGIKTGQIGENKAEFDLINGYQTNEYFTVGLGVGYRDIPDNQQKQMPVYLHIRGYFSDSKISPYAALSLGYTFDLKNDFKPLGVFIYPHAGVSMLFPKNMALNLGIGYELQMLEFYAYSYYSTSKYTDLAQAVSINIGFTF